MDRFSLLHDQNPLSVDEGTRDLGAGGFDQAAESGAGDAHFASCCLVVAAEKIGEAKRFQLVEPQLDRSQRAQGDSARFEGPQAGPASDSAFLSGTHGRNALALEAEVNHFEHMPKNNRAGTGRIEVTVLAENTARARGLRGEHGLAFWIRTPEGPLLFDTGQGLVLEANAEALGIDLAEARAVVLSHGHYDHVGGLPSVLAANPRVPLFYHPDAERDRYLKRGSGRVDSVSTPFLREARAGGRLGPVHGTRDASKVLGEVWVTGPIPRETSGEDVGGDFCLDPHGREPDAIADDQALFFKTASGTVVVLGCAHAGVMNTLRKVGELTGREEVHAVIGGMHLLHADAARIRRTGDFLGEANVRLLAPLHCTGTAAVENFRSRFGKRFAAASVGSRFAFDAA